MIATIIALSSLSFLIAVFAFTMGYAFCSNTLYSYSKQKGYGVHKWQTSEDIINTVHDHAYHIGYQDGLRDGREYIERGIKQEDND